jgi:hypothetical protein
MGSFSTLYSDVDNTSERQYLTVRETSQILGLSDDFVRRLLIDLLERGVLIRGDVLEIPPRPGARRVVRKEYRQFRIHRVTGLEKIKAYLAPRLDKS